jgi:hypothetical protein
MEPFTPAKDASHKMKLEKNVINIKDLEVSWNDMFVRFRIQEGVLVEIFPIETNLPYKKRYMHWEFYAKAIQAALKEANK